MKLAQLTHHLILLLAAPLLATSHPTTNDDPAFSTPHSWAAFVPDSSPSSIPATLPSALFGAPRVDMRVAVVFTAEAGPEASASAAAAPPFAGGWALCMVVYSAGGGAREPWRGGEREFVQPRAWGRKWFVWRGPEHDFGVVSRYMPVGFVVGEAPERVVWRVLRRVSPGGLRGEQDARVLGWVEDAVVALTQGEKAVLTPFVE